MNETLSEIVGGLIIITVPLATAVTIIIAGALKNWMKHNGGE